MKLEYTHTSRWDQHKTWTRIANGEYELSPLQNQFALCEWQRSVDEAADMFRYWLWAELQDDLNIVYREMERLALAEMYGQYVEILVPENAVHGDVIVAAVLWMLEAKLEVEVARAIPDNDNESMASTWDLGDRWDWDEESEPDHRLIWLVGRTQSRIGAIVDENKAFVPEYGYLRISDFLWVQWISREDAVPLQSMIKYEMDRLPDDILDFPLEYESSSEDKSTFERFEEKKKHEQSFEEIQYSEINQRLVAPGTIALANDLLAEGETADISAIITVSNLPDVEIPGRRKKSTYTAPLLPMDDTNIKPVYYRVGKDPALRVISAENQANRTNRYHYADCGEYAEFVKMNRSFERVEF
ncbi:MAG: hypothetical protein AAF702_01635 [Chloroflexota bacterium]